MSYLSRCLSLARIGASELSLRASATICHLTHGRPKSAYAYLWSTLFVRNVGPGLLDPVYRRVPHAAPYPREIEVEVTTKCHLKCVICERTYWKEPSKDLTFEEFEYVVDQFPDLKWINATGEGSAFLNKRYLAMLRHLKSRGVFVKLVDSLDMIDERTLRELTEMGVDRVVVSMDGAAKQTYEAIKLGASFDRVLANLETLAQLKTALHSPLPSISFRYIITELNVQEIPAFVRLVHSLGVSNRIQFAGLLEFEQITDLGSDIPVQIRQRADKTAAELGVRLSWSHCGTLAPITECAAWTQPYIMMGGYVLPCCALLMSNERDFLREHSLGNIFQTPFKEIWDSDRYREFRRMVPKSTGKLPLFCKGCRAYDTMGREV